MIDSLENAQAVVDLLESMIEADPDATRALFAHRVACNRALAEHPTVIVRPKDEPCGAHEVPHQGDWDVGFLGVVNALFGPTHRVASVTDDEKGLVDFKVVDVTKNPSNPDHENQPRLTGVERSRRARRGAGPPDADLISRAVDSMIPLRNSEQWEPGDHCWDQADQAARVAHARRLNALGWEARSPDSVRIVPPQKLHSKALGPALSLIHEALVDQMINEALAECEEAASGRRD